MRIVSGERRGLKLNEVPETFISRPTADRVKEAMFDIIRFRRKGQVLDLFAGTGQLGIEALSNGAESAVFCDNNADSIAVVNKNVSKAGYEAKSRVLLTDYKRFLKNDAEKGGYAVIFLDPPFDSPLLLKAIGYIDEYGVLAPHGVILAEAPADADLPDSVGGLIKEKSYKYGTVAVHLYSYGREEDE